VHARWDVSISNLRYCLNERPGKKKIQGGRKDCRTNSIGIDVKGGFEPEERALSVKRDRVA